MTRFCPPAVVVDQNLEILQFRGSVTPFLQPASGKASLNLFNMLHPGLEFELRPLIDRAKSNRSNVRREGLQIEIGGAAQMLSLEVIPVGGVGSQCLGFIIAFETTRTSSPQVASEDTYNAERLRITQLETELVAAREHLQSVINEREVAN